MKKEPTMPVPKLVSLFETWREVDPWIPVHTMLAVLMVAESEPRGILQNELAERLNLSQAAMSRNVLYLSPIQSPKLLGRGLVEIETVPENRRLRRMTLSPKGTKLLERLLTTIS